MGDVVLHLVYSSLDTGELRIDDEGRMEDGSGWFTKVSLLLIFFFLGFRHRSVNVGDAYTPECLLSGGARVPVESICF